MRTADKIRFAVVLAGWLVIVVMAAWALDGCAANPPCKVHKPDPRIITHDTFFDNEGWHCVQFGNDAKTHKPVFQCESKVDGTKILVYVTDLGQNHR